MGVQDVAVIGAGVAGLQCAVTIKELRPQAEVLLLESQDAVGGSARWAVGSFTAGGTRWQATAGVDDSPEGHLQDAKSMCTIRQPAYDELLAQMCRRAPALLESLAARGVEFSGPYTEAPHRQPRMHNAVPDASAVASVLAKSASELGVKIVTNSPVDDILPAEDGGFDVHAGTAVFLARRLVIASGDTSATDPTFPAINPGSTGVPQELVAERFAARLEPSRLAPWLRTMVPGRPHVSPTADLVRQATVRLAERELSGAEFLANPTSVGAEPLHLVLTTDEKTSEQTIACTYPTSGYASLADLVTEGLAWREGGSVVLGPLVMAVTLVDSGLVVDEQLRALGVEGEPIPGVYACGSAALGGLSMGGHGHHLLWAVATGERVGEKVAGGL